MCLPSASPPASLLDSLAFLRAALRASENEICEGRRTTARRPCGSSSCRDNVYASYSVAISLPPDLNCRIGTRVCELVF